MFGPEKLRPLAVGRSRSRRIKKCITYLEDEDLGFSVSQLTFNTFPGTISLLAKETAKHTKSYQLYYLANFTSKLENMA